MITVLLPVYNAEAFVGEAVESILKQSFTDFELLVINDGSADNSRKIVESFKDSRIRLVDNEKNIRLLATLNKGLNLSRGKYIARMDADDVCYPQRLQKQVNFMELNPSIGLCGTWFESFGKERKVVKYPKDDEDIRIMLLYQTAFCHPTVMYRRELYEKHKPVFLPDVTSTVDSEIWAREDLEVWIGLAEFTRFANIPEVLLQYRVHEQSITGLYKEIQEKNTCIVIQKYFLKAGIPLEVEEIQLFRAIAYSTFFSDQKNINRAESVLLKIVNGNKASGYLPGKKLNDFIGEKWKHLCMNASLGSWIFEKYSKSPLTKLSKAGTIQRMKFYLKTMIN